LILDGNLPNACERDWVSSSERCSILEC
jgi:hypothetical protein